jgi:hypothetical protein
MGTPLQDPLAAATRLRNSVAAVRSQAIDLLTEASRQGLGRHDADAVTRLQRVANDLGVVFEALPGHPVEPIRDPLIEAQSAASRDAAAVLTLGYLTVPANAQPVDKADRWIRILRQYGRVGEALERLGVRERPLATVADPSDSGGDSDSEEMVARWAGEFARRAGAPTVDTVHVLFAVRKVFGSSLDHALYRRGTGWEQLTEQLVTHLGAEVAQ